MIVLSISLFCHFCKKSQNALILSYSSLFYWENKKVYINFIFNKNYLYSNLFYWENKKVYKIVYIFNQKVGSLTPSSPWLSPNTYTNHHRTEVENHKLNHNQVQVMRGGAQCMRWVPIDCMSVHSLRLIVETCKTLTRI